MPQEGAHVHLIDPADPTSPVKVATGSAAPTDTGLVVHVASQPAGAGGGIDPVSIKDGANATQKLAVDVNGRVGINNFPATQPVSGTVTATGPLTDTQLRATAVPVSGTFFQATQPVSGTVTANAGTGPFPVSDNAGSLTIDAPVGTPAFVRLSDGAAAITNLAVNGVQVAGNAIAVDSGITSAGTQRVFQAAPTTANILVGHVAHTATTAAATIITIPANRTWMGTIAVSCDGSNSGAATGLGQALGLVATTGANTAPAPATVVSCEARWGANVTAGTVGTQGANMVTIPMVVSTGASGATLTLASTIVGTNGRVAAMCSGYLM